MLLLCTAAHGVMLEMAGTRIAAFPARLAEKTFPLSVSGFCRTVPVDDRFPNLIRFLLIIKLGYQRKRKRNCRADAAAGGDIAVYHHAVRQDFRTCQSVLAARIAGGFLSGKYTASTIFTGDDVRRVITRFAKENITANQPLLDLLEETAKEDNATPAQIALRWLLKKKPWIVPICGMRSESRMKENFGADCADLSNESFERLEKALSCIKIFGDRKDSDIAKLGTVKSVCVV